MEGISVDLVDSRLAPATAPETKLVDNRINHIAHFELLAPLLVLATQSLQLFLGYLVVIEVEDRVVGKDGAKTVEKGGLVVTKFQKGEEEAHVVLKDLGDHIQVLIEEGEGLGDQIGEKGKFGGALERV